MDFNFEYDQNFKQVTINKYSLHIEPEVTKRECNVVINNVPEKVVKGKHSNDSDLKFLHETCDFNPDEILSCFRAGKITEKVEGQIPKPRPLVVKLKSKEDAMWWCDNGKGWKVEVDSSDGPNKKEVYWINQDLNRADREAQFFVRQERRKRLMERAKSSQKIKF